MDRDDRTGTPSPRTGEAGLLAVREVAHELRVSPMTVRRLIRDGALRAHALGAQYRVTRADLDAYLTGAATGARP